MAEHKLKCWSDYWNAIERGDKNFEVRKDDRGYQRGDVLVLRKFNPESQEYLLVHAKHPEWPRQMEIPELRRQITYILTGGQFGIEPGYVVIGLAPCS